MTALRWMRRHLIVAGVLAALLAAVLVSPALGGPNFLTLTKAKKVFFTKKQSNSKFLTKSAGYTRGQADAAFLNQSEGDAAFLTPAEGNAAYLDQAEGDARYLPADSDTRLQISSDNWQGANSLLTVDYLYGQANLGTTGPLADQFFFAPVTIPQSLQGREVSIVNFELCYSGASPNATIDNVLMAVTQDASAANPFPLPTEVNADNTNRDDTTCHVFLPVSPYPLQPNDMVQIGVRVDFATAAGEIAVGRLTMNLAT
jgi:hypothetical protein